MKKSSGAKGKNKSPRGRNEGSGRRPSGPNRGSRPNHDGRIGGRGGDSTRRRFRDGDGVKSRGESQLQFNKKLRWVVGIHSVEEVLKVRPEAIKDFYIKESYERSEQFAKISKLLNRTNLEPKLIRENQLDDLCSTHQGIAVSVSESPEVDWDHLKDAQESIVVFLDGIEDPHNLGAILRTAWLMGVDAVFIPKDRSVALVPTACKVASGGAEHVPVEQVSNFTSELEQLKEYGYWVYGLAEGGEDSVYDLEINKKCVWIIGAEDKGMRKATEKACDIITQLPQVHGGSSYNASVAAAIALGETYRQQK